VIKTYYYICLFICFLVSPNIGNSALEDSEYFSTAVCESLEVVNQKIQFQSLFEKQKFFAYRSEVQTFLKNAPIFLQEKKQVNDMASVAIACALVDDATNAFENSCFTDDGASIDLTIVKDICENLNW
jgi:hypothetical protein